MKAVVLFALAMAFGASSLPASAATIEIAFGDRVYAMDVSKVCSKRNVSKNGYQLPVLQNAQTGTLVVGTQAFPGFKCARKIAGGGGSTVRQGLSASNHTGQTAEEVAEDLGLPPGSVGTIDPGPVVDHAGVIDTNNNGSSDDEAGSITAEGATQSDAQPGPGTPGGNSTGGTNTGGTTNGSGSGTQGGTQPDQGTPGDTTNGGNDGVSIF